MGLSDAITGAIPGIFTAISDLMTSVTYRRNVSGNSDNYDPTTGKVIDSATTIELAGLPYDYASREINNTTIRVTDKKMLIQHASLGFEPNVNDELEIAGITWHIVSKQSDPTGSIWILQIRRGAAS